MTLTLYFSPGSSSMAPHIALHEIGVPFAPGQYPKLSAHHARMMARPAVRRTCKIEAAIGCEPRR